MEILFHNICYRQILGLMNPEGAGVMEMDMLLPLLLPGEGMSQGVVRGSFQWGDMYEYKIYAVQYPAVSETLNSGSGQVHRSAPLPLQKQPVMAFLPLPRFHFLSLFLCPCLNLDFITL